LVAFGENSAILAAIPGFSCGSDVGAVVGSALGGSGNSSFWGSTYDHIVSERVLHSTHLTFLNLLSL
jgi:hypothetical protein